MNYAMISNHLYFLCNVYREENRVPLTKATLFKLTKDLFSSDYVTDLRQEFERAAKIDKKAGDNWHTQHILDRYEERRGCLSGFMKEAKDRIGRYTNKQHKRCGSVWGACGFCLY